MLCYCGSNKAFKNCCEPVISGRHIASSAEVLMRSRYVAYVLEDYGYVFRTYSSPERANTSEQEIKTHAIGTRWLKLEVLAHTPGSGPSTASVEFKAYSQGDGNFYLLHESSDFVKEQDEWRYASGDIHPDSGLLKLGRNDPCLCGSGKKFKKCCSIKRF